MVHPAGFVLVMLQGRLLAAAGHAVGICGRRTQSSRSLGLTGSNKQQLEKYSVDFSGLPEAESNNHLLDVQISKSIASGYFGHLVWVSSDQLAEELDG